MREKPENFDQSHWEEISIWLYPPTRNEEDIEQSPTEPMDNPSPG